MIDKLVGEIVWTNRSENLVPFQGCSEVTPVQKAMAADNISEAIAIRDHALAQARTRGEVP